MELWKCLRIVGFGALAAGLAHCGGSVEPPCAGDASGDGAALPDVLESGAIDGPEAGPLACWQCEPIGAVGAYNACTKTFLEACASCEVFGPSCTPSACAACGSSSDAAAE